VFDPTPIAGVCVRIAGACVRRRQKPSVSYPLTMSTQTTFVSGVGVGSKSQFFDTATLLTTQVAFTVTGPKRKIDEFAQGLKAEEVATMRTERAVMLSPL